MLIQTQPIPLSRRTLLRGAGAALALPWLEAMTPLKAASKGKKRPRRLGVLFMPNGVRQDAWTPQGTGSDLSLIHI